MKESRMPSDTDIAVAAGAGPGEVTLRIVGSHSPPPILHEPLNPYSRFLGHAFQGT